LRFLEPLGKRSQVPWAVCISLLEIKNYWFLVSNSESSRQAFSDADILVAPIMVNTLDRPFDRQNVASLLKTRSRLHLARIRLSRLP
jgi:hypothetical protein